MPGRDFFVYCRCLGLVFPIVLYPVGSSLIVVFISLSLSVVKYRRTSTKRAVGILKNEHVTMLSYLWQGPHPLDGITWERRNIFYGQLFIFSFCPLYSSWSRKQETFWLSVYFGLGKYFTMFRKGEGSVSGQVSLGSWTQLDVLSNFMMRIWMFCHLDFTFCDQIKIDKTTERAPFQT